MKIYINNNPEELLQPHSVSEILEQLNLAEARGIAVAINNQIVPKASWQAHLLQENDKLTVIRATQGG